MGAALSTRAEARVEIHAPQRGERRQLIDIRAAQRHARRSAARLADTASQQKLLVSLGQAFGLREAAAAASRSTTTRTSWARMRSAPWWSPGANGFMKQHYRTFNMKSEDLKPGDDYGMMREMLQRRFARLVKEEPRREAARRGAARRAGRRRYA